MATANNTENGVLRRAILSRLLLLTLINLWRFIFRPYDTSASLNPACLSSPASIDQSHPSDPILWPRLAAAIESSVVWDSVYFVRIAECGYEYEQSYAFLPLLPLSISLFSRSLFSPLIPLIGYRAVLALSGYVLNNFAFVLASIYLYRLSVLILKDSTAALLACTLFCFNPASIFYSSIYSESLYALFSFGGAFYLFSGYKTIAMFFLALSGSARSNGALNAGYFCFWALLQAYSAICHKKRPILAVRALFVGFLCSVIIFVPFLAFQAYGYVNICRNSYEPRPWCKAKIPLLYSFIQNHYWGVGFLRYFQVKQLPNFLLASPILSLSICSIIHYGKVFYQFFQSSSLYEAILLANDVKSKGINASSNDISISERRLSSDNLQGDLTVTQRRRARKDKVSESLKDSNRTGEIVKQINEESSILVFPFILHLAFMVFTAFFIMHVQVSTRFLSASPPIYWFASYLLESPSSTSMRLSYFIWTYFIAYILFGSLLFSNFYPFT